MTIIDLVRRAALILMLSLLEVTFALASAPAEFPRVQVSAEDGSTLKLSQVAREGKWLLIVVGAYSPESKTVLGMLKHPSLAPNLLGQIVVVVAGATVEKTNDLKAEFSLLKGVVWYANPDSSFYLSGVSNVPSILGMNKQVLAWRLSGVPADEKLDLKSAMCSWLRAVDATGTAK